jgi:hypothetical protein
MLTSNSRRTTSWHLGHLRDDWVEHHCCCRLDVELLFSSLNMDHFRRSIPGSRRQQLHLLGPNRHSGTINNFGCTSLLRVQGWSTSVRDIRFCARTFGSRSNRRRRRSHRWLQWCRPCRYRRPRPLSASPPRQHYHSASIKSHRPTAISTIKLMYK